MKTFKQFLNEAKKKFPMLDLNYDTEYFTLGMKDGNYIRFEDWYIYDMMSN